MASNDSAHVTLREVFTPLFARVLLFVRNPNSDRQTFAEVRKEIEALLEDQKLLIKRYEIPQQDYDNARFAAVAWVDEMMRKASFDTNKELYRNWERSLLQDKLYETTNAGEEFFDRLEKIKPTQKEICEIYHLCLCLGFRGQYYDEDQDYKLHELKRTSAQYLPVPFPDRLDLEKTKERVTPQPYDVPQPPARPLPRPLSSAWLAIPLAGIIALLLYLLWPETPGLSRAAIEEALQRFDCHTMQVANIREGVVSLTGRVQDDAQRQQVHQAIHRIPGVTGVEDTFTFLPHPFCDVIALLAPFQARATALEYGLAVHPQNGCDAIYRNGETLVVDITAAKPLRHLYVDYYAADKKTVAHLLPNEKQTIDVFHNTNTVTIGDEQNSWRMTIRKPFGMELVTVITSPTPLFPTPHTAPEAARPYIDALRRTLPQDPYTADVTAASCFLTSVER